MPVERVCEEFGYQPVKFFTVDEARKMLPLVKAIARDMVGHAKELQELQERFNAIRDRAGDDKDSAYQDEVDAMESQVDAEAEKIQACLRELVELGIHPKDPYRGLIDWPTLVNDEPAYICWELGEEDIEFWHDLEKGYAGRRPVDELLTLSAK